MTITTDELKDHFKKYIFMSEKKEIYISKAGKTIAKMRHPQEGKETVRHLFCAL